LGIHGEIDAFLTRIYVAVANRSRSAKGFGAVTSLMVWGASFVNVEYYKTRWDAVQFLVHEITHSLLFGLACEQPLIQNSPDESYKSPLRADPRPMDGIFHATLVCARLADFNKAWLESGLVAGDDRSRCEEAILQNSRLFHDGLLVIDQNGKLSEQGRHLIDQSRLGLAVLA
jgi:HEXXH motif-containing protein